MTDSDSKLIFHLLEHQHLRFCFQQAFARAHVMSYRQNKNLGSPNRATPQHIIAAWAPRLAGGKARSTPLMRSDAGTNHSYNTYGVNPAQGVKLHCRGKLYCLLFIRECVFVCCFYPRTFLLFLLSVPHWRCAYLGPLGRPS